VTKKKGHVTVKKETKIITPLKAIKEKCLECCAGNKSKVRLCEIEDCALWSYRFGRGPKRHLTDEARAKLSQQAKTNFNRKGY